MRYRGREDICHKTTDEARPDSDEFSFTEGLFLVFFCNYTNYLIRIRKSIWGSRKKYQKIYLKHYLKHKASAYAVNIYLCISGLFCLVQCSSVAFWYAVNLSFRVIPADLKYCSVGYNRKKTPIPQFNSTDMYFYS